MSIIFKKEAFPKLKYKTKYDLAKEVSLNSKIELEILLETYDKEIEEKYFNTISELSNRYLVQSLKDIEKDINLFNFGIKISNIERGEMIINIKSNRYLILLDTDKLKKNLSDKLIRYTKEKWNIKTISDEINYLPLVYEFLLKNKKIELHYNENTINIEIGNLNKMNFTHVCVPNWEKNYITPPLAHTIKTYGNVNSEFKLLSEKLPEIDDYVTNYLQTQERKDFFNKFKDDFFIGNFYDLKDQSNYAFLLMFFIINSDIENKDYHLYNLGLCYPKTFLYHLEFSKNHILKILNDE